MGFWKKLLGVGEIAGGLVTGNPGLVATGAGTLAADSQDSAINKANQAQQQATDKAQGKLDQVYNQTAAAYAPYQQTGAGALSALNLGMGLQPLQPVGTAASGTATYPTPQQVVAGMPKANVGNLADIGLKGGTRGILDALERTPQAQAIMANNVAQAAQAQTQSGYVQMRDPNGNIGQVPASMVPHAVAAGGQIITGVGNG